ASPALTETFPVTGANIATCAHRTPATALSRRDESTPLRSALRSCPRLRYISLLESCGPSPCWPRTFRSLSPDRGTTSASSTSRAAHTASPRSGSTAAASSVRRPRMTTRAGTSVTSPSTSPWCGMGTSSLTTPPTFK
ncbi:hypothetical protein KUCAC02_013019, partial [Chaenocephalus aceratus]